MSGGLPRARELAAELGQWAASADATEPEAPSTCRARLAAAQLTYELAGLHPLWFALGVAHLMSHLERLANQRPGDDPAAAAAAASYVKLLYRLGAIFDDDGEIMAAVAEAIEVFDDARQQAPVRKRGGKAPR